MITLKSFICSALVLGLMAQLLPTMGLYITEEEKYRGLDESCPTVNHYTAPYHKDTACDIVAQNHYKSTLDRTQVRIRLQETGTSQVPDLKTSFCPQEVQPLVTPQHVTGFDTAWVVENTASTPVVISHVLQKEDGTFSEVSPFDTTNKLSPPNHDPKAILKPGEWKAVQTHEGHVFHVREILKDGSMGQVLLQHRVGLYPVTNKYGHELDCNPADPDPEPVVNKDGEAVRDPNYGRQKAKPLRPCNTIDFGFRNEVGCPLNAYYTGTYALKGIAKPRGNVTELNRNPENHTAKSCHEVFQFHLGLLERTPHFMFHWNSKTKYESTYIGHHYVFRYAKDERIVVDSMALQPTKVVDCPGLKNQVNAVTAPTAETIPISFGRRDYFRLTDYMQVKNLNATIMMNSTLPPLQTTGRREFVTASGIPTTV